MCTAVDHPPPLASYISLSALLFSGDSYLQEQSRGVVERSGDFLLATGQLPHHFDGNTPVYIALSGATQVQYHLPRTARAVSLACPVRVWVQEALVLWSVCCRPPPLNGRGCLSTDWAEHLLDADCVSVR